MNRAIGRVPRALLFMLVLGVGLTAVAREPRGAIGVGRTDRCARENVLVLEGELDRDGRQHTETIIGNIYVDNAGGQYLALYALSSADEGWRLTVSDTKSPLAVGTYDAPAQGLKHATLTIDRLHSTGAGWGAATFQIHELTVEDGKMRTALISFDHDRGSHVIHGCLRLRL